MIAGCQLPGSAASDVEIMRRLADALRCAGAGVPTRLNESEPGLLYSDPEPATEASDVTVLRRGAVLLTWDGRLDNRDDLARSLEAPPGAGELELLARAYERWGAGFAERVVGDFALALWDGARRRLVLARDPFGVRPLFYAPRAGGGLVWASSLRLLRAAGVELGDLDEDWIAGFFARSIDPATTPWRGARAVPPGCAVVAEDGRLRCERGWRFEDARELRLGSDAEFEEGFRALFFDAVRRRLRARGPVTAELSGGLDSSSIVCAAEHLLRAGQAAPAEFLTLSYVYDRSASADESRFIGEVAAHTGREPHRIRESEFPLLSGLVAASLDVPSGMACFRALYRCVFEFMGERGSRVLLSGIGGDNLLTSQVGAPHQLADLLRQGRLRALFAAARGWRREQDRPYLHLLWEGALCPLLPRPLRLRLAPVPIPIPPWLDRAFVRRQDLRARGVAAVDLAGGFAAPSKREQIGAVRSAVRAVAWRYDWWGAAVQFTYPFLDRDLVEFCLGAPSDQFVRGVETRSLHRRALAGVLPARIARRKDKRGPDEPILRAVAERWDELSALLDRPRTAERGWIEPGAFRRALQEARFGKPAENLLALLTTLALEAWLRALEAA